MTLFNELAGDAGEDDDVDHERWGEGDGDGGCFAGWLAGWTETVTLPPRAAGDGTRSVSDEVHERDREGSSSHRVAFDVAQLWRRRTEDESWSQVGF